MNDGIIEIDSDRAKPFGFTSDKFANDSYLWKEGDRIIISLIISKNEGKGNLSGLFDAIESNGYKIAVPCPFAKMTAILEHKGFKQTFEECEIWIKPLDNLPQS